MWIRLLYCVLLVVSLLYGCESKSSSNQEESNKPPVEALQKDIETIQEKADQGDKVAQRQLGSAYYYGKDTVKNIQKAIEWWGKAADQGDPAANYNIGLLYIDGEGVKQDKSKAADYLRVASLGGDKDAMYQLGLLYKNGDCERKYKNDGVICFQEAAKLGHVKAMYELGRAFLYGEGVKSDIEEANKWFSKASDSGDEDAKFGLQQTKEILKRKQEERENTRKIVQKVSYIAQKYTKDHSYSMADRFVCIDMAIDVWNQLKTAGIHAVFQMGNLDFDFPERFNFKDLTKLNHIWLLVEVAPNTYVPLETTAGQMVSHDYPYYDRYWKGPQLSTPKQVKEFESMRGKACESCGMADRGAELFNRHCAGRRVTRDCVQLEGMYEIKQQECKEALDRVRLIISGR